MEDWNLPMPQVSYFNDIDVEGNNKELYDLTFRAPLVV